MVFDNVLKWKGSKHTNCLDKSSNDNLAISQTATRQEQKLIKQDSLNQYRTHVEGFVKTLQDTKWTCFQY